MNVRDFEYIVELASQGNITRAAGRLFVTQSTLTKFLQKIELEIGAPLFIRNGGLLEPTAIGRSCIARAREIIDINDNLNEELERGVMKENGDIRVGLSASRFHFVIQSVLPPFLTKYPSCNVMIRRDSTYNLINLLQNGAIEVFLGSYVKETADLLYQLIGQEEMVLAVSTGSCLLEKGKKLYGLKFPYLPAEAWIGERLILPSPHTVTGRYVRDYLRECRIVPAQTLNIQGLDNVRFAVSQGLGVAIMPSMPLSSEEKLVYLSISRENILRKVVAGIRKEDSANKKLSDFLHILREVYHT